MLKVETYNDPIDFENGTDIKYPCNTQYMVYSPLRHMYFLTEEALAYYGLDVQRQYNSISSNKVQEFIDKVSKKIYDTIRYKCGLNNYKVQMYRIATAPKALYEDQYSFRKMFEEILVSEAKWLLVNGDSAEYSNDNLAMPKQNLPPELQYRDMSDISKESLRSLNFLGLDRWFNIVQMQPLDTDKY